MADTLELSPYVDATVRRSLYRRLGRVEQAVGTIIESRGPAVGVGDLCEIRATRTGPPALAEAVGFRGDRVQLMSFSAVPGLALGAEVRATHRPFRIAVGDGFLGRVVDAFSRPIDHGPAPSVVEQRPVTVSPPGPLERRTIDTPVATGVRAIDAFMTCGGGQRIGIFSGSGVGKSTLLGMVARNTSADVNVIALIGERGREVREFMDKDLGAEGLARSVVVVATSDQSPLTRVKAAQTAMTHAEYFRDRGLNVMFMMDSVTRTAMALREIGLATGEPPTSRGYTPSVFAFLPPFLERAGHTERGSITGFFTVLVEADDMNDPIGDAARSILDGHIVLSRDLAARNHYPAIDVLSSVSRVMNDVVDAEHRRVAGELRSVLAIHAHFEDLITVGAYRQGQNRELDRAVAFLPRLQALLRQRTEERGTIVDTRNQLVAIAKDVARYGSEGGARA